MTSLTGAGVLPLAPRPDATPGAAPTPLSVGVPALDRQGAFAPGAFTLLTAPRSVLAALESRLLLGALARERDALVVVGDNRFDAYGLLAHARARGLETALADGTWIARAFTVHQFVALLEETLPRLARERPAGLALVPGFVETFLDEDVRPREGRVLLARSVRRLAAWAERQDFAVVATSDAASAGSPMASIALRLAPRHVALDGLVPEARRQPTLASFGGA